ncbi:MAG: hypothetical protein ACI4PQ_00040 [Butyricicoccaceae bacterium]
MDPKLKKFLLFQLTSESADEPEEDASMYDVLGLGDEDEDNDD